MPTIVSSRTVGWFWFPLDQKWREGRRTSSNNNESAKTVSFPFGLCTFYCIVHVDILTSQRGTGRIFAFLVSCFFLNKQHAKQAPNETKICPQRLQKYRKYHPLNTVLFNVHCIYETFLFLYCSCFCRSICCDAYTAASDHRIEIGK